MPQVYIVKESVLHVKGNARTLQRGLTSSRPTGLQAPSPPAFAMKSGSSRSFDRPGYGATEMHRQPASESETFFKMYSDETDFTRICCEVIGWLLSE